MREFWQSAARSIEARTWPRKQGAFLLNPTGGLWVVANDVGEPFLGAQTSRMIVDYLAQRDLTGSFDVQVRQLRDHLQYLNRRIASDYSCPSQEPGKLLGSTVVALLADEERAACLWAGDCRCYLWRDQQVYQLTRDHSLARRLIERGLSAEQAARQPGAHLLTQAIGKDGPLELDVLELSLYPGDSFLLCNDEVHQTLSEDELGEALRLPIPAASVDELLDRAQRARAYDTLTAIVVQR